MLGDTEDIEMTQTWIVPSVNSQRQIQTPRVATQRDQRHAEETQQGDAIYHPALPD